MGTFLGVVFIVTAAATGIYVGTRPTVMDGRWVADKLSKAVKDEELALECDRAIPVGVKGAKFRCVQSRLGATQEVWFRMSREGTLERTELGRIKRDGAAGGARRGPGPESDEDDGGDPDDE